MSIEIKHQRDSVGTWWYYVYHVDGMDKYEIGKFEGKADAEAFAKD